SSGSWTADGDGNVSFSLYATNAVEWNADGFEPAKIVVSSRGADDRAVVNEFKVFFVNMSHLYFRHGADGAAAMAVVKDAVDEWLELAHDGEYSEIDPA